MFKKYTAILLTAGTGAVGFGVHRLMLSENDFKLSFDEPIEITNIISEIETVTDVTQNTNSNEQQASENDSNAIAIETLKKLEEQKQKQHQELLTLNKSYKELVKTAIENVINVGNKAYIKIILESGEEQKWCGDKININISNDQFNLTHKDNAFERKNVPGNIISFLNGDYHLYIASSSWISNEEYMFNNFKMSWDGWKTNNNYSEDWYFIYVNESDERASWQIESKINKILNDLSLSEEEYSRTNKTILKQKNNLKI